MPFNRIENKKKLFRTLFAYIFTQKKRSPSFKEHVVFKRCYISVHIISVRGSASLELPGIQMWRGFEFQIQNTVFLLNKIDMYNNIYA